MKNQHTSLATEKSRETEFAWASRLLAFSRFHTLRWLAYFSDPFAFERCVGCAFHERNRVVSFERIIPRFKKFLKIENEKLLVDLAKADNVSYVRGSNLSRTETKEIVTQEEALVLIGSTRQNYIDSLLNFLKDNKAIWSAWDFRIRKKWRKAIRNRLKSQIKFPVLFYMSKKRGGSGKIEFVGVFDDIVMSDAPIKSPDPSLTDQWEREYPTEDFQSYTWFRFYEVAPFGPVDLSCFMDIGTEDPIKPSQLRASFAYAYLPEDFEERLEEGQPTEISLSVEKDLKKFLVMNLSSLEEGLELFADNERIGEEYPTDVGRIDILASDLKKNLVVIELKAGTADSSAYGQISAYMAWVKQNVAKGKNVRGIIVANDFDRKLKHAVTLLPSIRLKRYEVNFSFKDVSLQ